MKAYLDNAATTPIAKEVFDAMVPYFTEHCGNPSSIHSWGRATRAAIEAARKTVAGHLNASTGEIFFTSCGTESNNTALKCAVQDYGIKHIITSRIEHHAVLHSIEELKRCQDIECHFVNVDCKGNPELDHLEALLKGINKRCLVSLMHANNELGTMIDLDAVGEICDKYKALFHSDTVQTMAHFRIDTQKTKVHFLTGSAHKFHGPKGVGFMYINADVTIHPYMHGGSQERNMRAGTENVYGIVGLAKAMDLAYEHLEDHRAYVSGLKNYMMRALKEHIPGVEFNGETGDNSLYTVLNVSFPPGFGTDMLVFKLDMAGIAASGGSACSSGSDAGSHVMKALGADPSRKSVRFSFSKYNTREELDYVLLKLKEMVPVAV